MRDAHIQQLSDVPGFSFEDDDLSDLGARRRMRAALEWIEPGSIADKMLQDANAYLIGLRAAGDGDALPIPPLEVRQ